MVDWLLLVLKPHVPNLLPSQLVLLDLGQLEVSTKLPVIWLLAEVWGYLWECRREKKKPKLYLTRAKIEAGISILRKSRFSNAATIIEEILNTTSL